MESRKAPEDEKPLKDTQISTRDNSRHDEYENASNPMGPGDETEQTGQDGRNIRPFGGIDMDSQNGVLRMGDMDNSTMEVTDEAQKSIAGSDAQTTNTSTVSVTTHGPDDYASDRQVAVPNAQEQAKQQDDGTDANDSDTNAAVSQEEKSQDVAETGTSTDHQPAY